METVEMVVLVVTWQAKQGCDDEVAQVFRKLEVESRKEPGCVMYVVHRNRADSHKFFIYEQYKDDAALQAHRDSEHFRRYIGELPQIAMRVEGELYDPLTDS
jgi:quinol monooxygenase YgiN